MADSFQQRLDEGIALHRAGQLDRAAAIYAELLKKKPRHPDALHLSGHLHFLGGHYEQAERYVRKALKELPAFPYALHTLGQILQKQGKFAEAQKAFLKILKLDPKFEGAHVQLARNHRALGETDKALEIYTALAQRTPQDGVVLREYAALLQAVGRNKEAEDLLRRLPGVPEETPEARNNHAVGLLNEQRFEEARAHLEALLREHPKHAMAWSNLGVACENLKRFEEAEAAYRKAIEIEPDYADACFNLGNVCWATGKMQEAQAYYERAVSVNTRYAPAMNMLGKLHMEQERDEEAERWYKQSIEAEPVDNYHAFNGYSLLLRNQQRFDEAEVLVRKAIAVNPDFPDPYNSLGWVLNDNGKYAEAEQAFREGLRRNPDNRQLHSNLLMLLTYRMELGHKELFEEHVAYGQQHPPRDLEQLVPLRVECRAFRKLRVGYVSPDFKRHVVRNFIQPVIAAHDRDKVEVFCYAQVEKPDEVTEQIQQLCDHWLNTWGMDELALANRIREDAIDVLVELAGHSGNNRLDVFSYKPAPVQVSYLGYITTTGVPQIDYRITDPVMNPPGSPEGYTEELYHLDRCYKCYEPAPHEPPVNPEVSPAAEVVFGSLHRISKLTPSTIELWSGLLRALPRSKLLLARHELHFEENRTSVREAFKRCGVEPERLLLDDTYGYKTHMEIYRKIDIGLDPIPVVGGATTAEALWMGVPVLTLQGEAFRERISSSLLDAVGLKGWIANDVEDYVAKGVAFANDYHERLRLRANMRELFLNSPLGDAKGLATALEDAYIDMWHRYLAKTR